MMFGSWTGGVGTSVILVKTYFFGSMPLFLYWIRTAKVLQNCTVAIIVYSCCLGRHKFARQYPLSILKHGRHHFAGRQCLFKFLRSGNPECRHWRDCFLSLVSCNELRFHHQWQLNSTIPRSLRRGNQRIGGPLQPVAIGNVQYKIIYIIFNIIQYNFIIWAFWASILHTPYDNTNVLLKSRL